MKNSATPLPNRVADEIAAEMAAVWNPIEERRIHRKGKESLNDPDFLAARQNTYRKIYNKYRKQHKNLAEKAELRVIRSERRAILRRMYPNPFVRLARNAVVFALNVLAAILKAALRLTTALASGVSQRMASQQVLQKNAQQAQNNGQRNNHRQSETSASLKNGTHYKKGQSNVQAFIRRKPRQPRVVTPVAAVKGMGKR